jgi:hypothetical protein
MMRTVEVILAIVILASAFVIGSFFAVSLSPRQISSLNLQELALTTLQMLDQNNGLNQIVFKTSSDASWGYLQTALTASLPSNMLYNFTVYNVTSTGQYKLLNSLSNTKTGLGTSSESASIIVPSSNVTFSFNPQKSSVTLYILNCSDANGWWITGYTAQSLASNLQSILSPYFNRTIMVQNTTQLGKILNDTSLQGEKVKNATVINPFGEAVPIPAGYYSSNGVGYDTSSNLAGGYHYARYTYMVGLRVYQYNWTWVSIVGWPFYYVSNTKLLSLKQNGWGIYGMNMTMSYGLQAFLEGLNNQGYSYATSTTNSTGVVSFTPSAAYYCNYYGIYPSPYQTATRALSINNTFGLTATSVVFNPVQYKGSGVKWIAAATYKHTGGGAFTAIGLTRIPDIRIAALALLMYYQPSLFASASTSTTSTRLVVLQLGLQGGG